MISRKAESTKSTRDETSIANMALTRIPENDPEIISMTLSTTADMSKVSTILAIDVAETVESERLRANTRNMPITTKTIWRIIVATLFGSVQHIVVAFLDIRT